MNKTYAFSDVHGMYNLWNKIKNFCDETDIIYFLGDACDRGKDGVSIIAELLQDKRIKYLKGNHEDMLTICLPEMIEGHFENWSWWWGNGGGPTWKILETLPWFAQSYFIRKLNELPKTAWYESPKGHKVFLSHAGTNLNYTEKELILKGVGHGDPYLWDRSHFYSKHPKNMPNVYQVHGHTPVVSHYFSGKEDIVFPLQNPPTMIKYCDGHKFNIDMGSFITNRTCLLDLDTFEPIYFDIKEE